MGFLHECVLCLYMCTYMWGTHTHIQSMKTQRSQCSFPSWFPNFCLWWIFICANFMFEISYPESWIYCLWCSRGSLTMTSPSKCLHRTPVISLLNIKYFIWQKWMFWRIIVCSISRWHQSIKHVFYIKYMLTCID